MTARTRNGLLAATGLSALTIYILACTAFSPDGRHLLYPVYDNSGAFAMAVYDREEKRSEIIFTPVLMERPGESNAWNLAATPLRGQWLPDGKRIAIVATTGDSDEALLMLLPFRGGAGGTRMFTLSSLGLNTPAIYTGPLCIHKDRLFGVSENQKEIIRLDLVTGEVVTRPAGSGELTLLPGPDERLYYAETSGGEDSKGTFGRMDPDTFERSPILQIATGTAENGFIAYNNAGTALALMDKNDSLVIYRKGQEPLRKPFPGTREGRSFANAVFLPDDKTIVAAGREELGDKKFVYSIWEIPVSDGQVRQTELFQAQGDASGETVFYTQLSVSPDGKTAALSSTYVAAMQEVAAKDCALFLVNLADKDRKITRVAIPQPKGRTPKLN